MNYFQSRQAPSNQSTSAPSNSRRKGPSVASAVLQLQRRAGNRAVQQLIPARVQDSTLVPIMRAKVNLSGLYQGKVNRLNDPDRTKYAQLLADFIRIQDLLFDEKRVMSYLGKVSAVKAAWSLDDHLAEFENAFAAARPVLLADAGAAFTRIVNRGQMFVDLVAVKHGMHAHRLQWNIIGQDIQSRGGYHNSSVELYREASRQWWRTDWEGKPRRYLWEQIIDAFGGKEQKMFSSPENLTTAISEAGLLSGLLRLWWGQSSQEAKRTNLRDQICKRYVDSDWFDLDERDVHIHTHRTVDGWTYTGFLKGRWRQGSGGLDPIPKEVPLPTVAYPPGHKPEARPR